MKKFFAFTLAETLIVMGIIGIVSALTLPNLNSSTGEKEKIAKVKKIYKDLEDAFGRAVAVYGPVDEWFVNDNCTGTTPCTVTNNACSKKLAERMTEFMKISKSCNTSTGCFKTGAAKTLEGSTGDNIETCAGYKFILADGTSVSFSASNKTFTGVPSDGSGFLSGAIVDIDIDGPSKGPYTHGKDVFQFLLTPDGFIPRGRNLTEEKLKALCFKTGASCAEWVIQHDNMDYLKADRDGKCPNNGPQLSWSNITCK